MKNKFDIVFEQTMKSLITEAYDRYSLRDVIIATCLSTNNCLDPWVKGETGSKIFTAVKQSGTKTTAHKFQQGSQFTTDRKSTNESGLNYTGNPEFDRTSILNYWRFKSSRNDEFSIGCMRDLSEADDGESGTEPLITAPKVGRIAWIVWKALNDRNVRNANNAEKMKEITSSGDWEVGTKVKGLDLIAYACYGGNEILCRDPKTSMKVKAYVKMDLSMQGIETLLYELTSGAPSKIREELAAENPEYKEIPINIDGKITKVNNEYAFVAISNVKLNSPTSQHIKELLHNMKILRSLITQRKEDNESRNSFLNTMIRYVDDFEHKDEVDEDDIGFSSHWTDNDFRTHFNDPNWSKYYEIMLDKFADSYTSDRDKETVKKFRQILDTYRNV